MDALIQRIIDDMVAHGIPLVCAICVVRAMFAWYYASCGC